jgi:hypothetical protein
MYLLKLFFGGGRKKSSLSHGCAWEGVHVFGFFRFTPVKLIKKILSHALTQACILQGDNQSDEKKQAILFWEARMCIKSETKRVSVNV